MFCNQCGKQNPDSARFCNFCGAPMAGPMVTIYQPRKQERNAEIAELERMIRYFSQKSALYGEYDNVSAEIDSCSKGKHYALLIWGIIVSFAATMMFSAINSSDTKTAVIALIPFLIGQGMIVGHIIYAVSFNKRLDMLTCRYDELSSELFDYYRGYGTCLIGPEYTNPSNLITILNTIKSGRADTTKDAINILVEDAYRRNMQQFAAQAARSAAAAARGARVSAVFSAANFFLR